MVKRFYYAFLMIMIVISQGINVSGETYIDNIYVTTHSAVLKDCSGTCKFFFEIALDGKDDLKYPENTADYYEGAAGENITTEYKFTITSDVDNIELVVVHHLSLQKDEDFDRFSLDKVDSDHKVYEKENVRVSVSVKLDIKEKEPFSPANIFFIIIIIAIAVLTYKFMFSNKTDYRYHR